MKRNVNSLADRNAIKFNLLAQDYTKLSQEPVPEDLFSTFTAEEFYGNEETSIENKDVNQFGTKKLRSWGFGDEETMDLFGEKIVKQEKQPMYENYVQYYNMK